MRLTLLAASVLVLTSCGGSTSMDPNAQWNGTWTAVSLNGSPLPVNYTVGSTQVRAVYRRLTLLGNQGTWSDSTETTPNGTTFYSGHHNFITWSIAGDQIMVIANNAPSSDFVLNFAVQSDGSLLETHQDAATVVYRR